MSALRVARGVLDIAPYVPGRSNATGGARTIRLASNETPLGASPLAVEAFRRCAARLHRYPDGSAAALREALGARHGLDPARIVCGNGSDDLLYLLAAVFTEPGDEALFTDHAFAIYRIAAQAAGARPVAAPERRLTADVDALLARAGPNTRICYLANPNNPTGTYIPAAELARLRAGLPEHCLLAVDAAYAEYMRGGDYADGAALVDSHGATVMTRSFSKIYGLSALRLGWLYGPPEVVDALNRARAPFNVNRAAQEAGIAAAGDTEFVARAVAHNDEWRPWLERGVESLGLTAHPSTANFALAEFPAGAGRGADAAYAFLLERGIIARRVANYGLPRCLRFSVGLADENRAVIDALREFVRTAPRAA